MLKVQEWLNKTGGDFVKLEEQLGIRAQFNDTDDRVILNYSQIDSPKTNPIVMECRALTLNKNDYSLISRSMGRFFNAGEAPQINNNFNFNAFVTHDKEDGSLIKVYYYRNKWIVETRGSFAQGTPSELCPHTWEDLVWQTLPDDFINKASKITVYVFELCTNWNRVVRQYDEPSIFLLTEFIGEEEVNHDIVATDANFLGLKIPNIHQFNNLTDAQLHLTKIAENDPTYEGVVLRDCSNLRIKVKSPKWFALARLKEGALTYKNLIPIVLDGEYEEVLLYFPELKDKIFEVKGEIEKVREEVGNYWFAFGEEKNRKKFAMAVKPCRYNAVLFRAWVDGTHPFDYLTSDFLVKAFK